MNVDSFWSRVDVTPTCWLWIGPRHPKGYGYVGHRGRAHRVAYEITHGPIPDGMVVMHTCDNPPCVRPDHLRLGTVADNNRDREAKRGLSPNLAIGRAILLERARSRTHCPQGHEYSASNTRIRRTGARACKACENARRRRRHALLATGNGMAA